MKRARYLSWVAIGGAVILLVGCAAKRVMVPPNIDLNAYNSIGMVQFSSNAEGNLDQFASQKFVQTVQASQPGIRVLELGDRERVLREIEQDELDYSAIQAIGQKYNVDAIIVGNIEVTDVKPTVDLSTLLSSMGLQADVEASLTTRLYETETGATIWTRSARGKETVAHVGMGTGGPVHFGASDPEDAYGKLVNGLVYRVTEDFRVRYVRQ